METKHRVYTQDSCVSVRFAFFYRHENKYRHFPIVESHIREFPEGDQTYARGRIQTSCVCSWHVARSANTVPLKVHMHTHCIAFEPSELIRISPLIALQICRENVEIIAWKQRQKCKARGNPHRKSELDALPYIPRRTHAT